MNITPIQRKFITGALVLGGIIAVSHCGDNARTLKKIAEENGYSKERITEMLDDTRCSDIMAQTADRQAVIDSIAYGALLNETPYANEYKVKSEFAATSYKLRIANFLSSADRDFIEINRRDGASKRELDSLSAENHNYSKKLSMPRSYSAGKQFRFDKHFYKKFFEKLGLMKDKQFQDKFEKVSERIEP